MLDFCVHVEARFWVTRRWRWPNNLSRHMNAWTKHLPSTFSVGTGQLVSFAKVSKMNRNGVSFLYHFFHYGKQRVLWPKLLNNIRIRITLNNSSTLLLVPVLDRMTHLHGYCFTSFVTAYDGRGKFFPFSVVTKIGLICWSTGTSSFKRTAIFFSLNCLTLKWLLILETPPSIRVPFNWHCWIVPSIEKDC